MAQTTILAEGQTAATSSDVVVAAATQVNIGIFATGSLHPLAEARLMMDTPGGDVELMMLSRRAPVAAVFGPGTFRVVRPANTNVDAFGSFSET